MTMSEEETGSEAKPSTGTTVAQFVTALGLLSWEGVAHFVGVDIAVDSPDEVVERQVAVLIKPAARCGEEVIECLGAHGNTVTPSTRGAEFSMVMSATPGGPRPLHQLA